MRILEVVTLVSPDSEYGGPTRVAVNQAAALQKRGHDVTIAASTRGFRDVPTHLDDVPARLFPSATAIPGTGFAGLASPGMQRWLRANVSSFDIVHVHAARDLVTLPAARITRSNGVPYVLQTHGMIDPSKNPLARPFDAVLTRRVLTRARRVFYLTPTEKSGLIAVAGDKLGYQHLPNGVPRTEPPTSYKKSIEVLFLARLAPRKRPLAFVYVAIALCAAHPDVRFALVGPDEGEAGAIDAAIAASGYSDRIRREPAVPPEDTLDRMSEASIYVLPSVNEPYPMSVLEAMSLSLPVVITESCGLARLVQRSGAGIVVDETIDSLAKGIDRMLLDRAFRERLGENGMHVTRAEHSMDTIAQRLEESYAASVAG